MKTEYEVRVLEIDSFDIISKLEDLGAVKENEYFQRRYVYDFTPIRESEWIRLRTDGFKTTLTYKNVESKTVDGTKELEIVVDDFDNTNKMLEILGYKCRGIQENKRIRYILEGIEIDIDTWPLIPTYLEIEGGSEAEVMNIIDKLNIVRDKVCTLDVQSIYEHYGIIKEDTNYLSFNEGDDKNV